MSGLQKRLDSHVNVVETITPYAKAQAPARGTGGGFGAG